MTEEKTNAHTKKYAHLHWETMGVEEGDDYRVFKTQRVQRQHPQTANVHTYSVIHSPNWVNVIAVTTHHEIVLIRQFRHGTNQVTLEIPGGMVDPKEEGSLAAQRELREETGFTSDQWIYLGSVNPNPAIQSNHCTTWLALNAEQTARTHWDAGEVIDVLTVPLDQVDQLIATGQINHALVVAAFYWYRQYQDTHG